MDMKEKDAKVDLMIKKKHKYKYYKIVKTITNKNGIKEDIVFDFEDWLEKQNKAIDEKETLIIDKLLYRIDTVEFIEERYYIIKFYKFRLEQEITKLKERTPVEVIKLNYDEYVGEPTMFLYDVLLHRCMIKSNRYSLSEKDYINIFKEHIAIDEDIKLKNFVDPDFESKLKNGGFKKIEISMFGLNKFDGKDINKKGSLNSFLKSAKDTGANTLNIKIGLGHTRDVYLNKKKTTQIIEDIGKVIDFISMAKASVNNNGKTEDVDILRAILKSEIEYIINPRDSVRYNIEKIEMLNEYKNVML